MAERFGAGELIDDEEISWLECLVGEYDREHDWDADEDPGATSECLASCRALAKKLRARLTPPPVRVEAPAIDQGEIPF
jgi:hypothetical protein